MKFAQDLANYDIQFEPRTSMRGQALADFFAELTPGLLDEANLLLLAEEKRKVAEADVTDDIVEPQLDAMHAQFTMGNKRVRRE